MCTGDQDLTHSVVVDVEHITSATHTGELEASRDREQLEKNGSNEDAANDAKNGGVVVVETDTTTTGVIVVPAYISLYAPPTTTTTTTTTTITTTVETDDVVVPETESTTAVVVVPPEISQHQQTTTTTTNITTINREARSGKDVTANGVIAVKTTETTTTPSAVVVIPADAVLDQNITTTTTTAAATTTTNVEAVKTDHVVVPETKTTTDVVVVPADTALDQNTTTTTTTSADDERLSNGDLWTRMPQASIWLENDDIVDEDQPTVVPLPKRKPAVSSENSTTKGEREMVVSSELHQARDHAAADTCVKDRKLVSSSSNGDESTTKIACDVEVGTRTSQEAVDDKDLIDTVTIDNIGAEVVNKHDELMNKHEHHQTATAREELDMVELGVDQEVHEDDDNVVVPLPRRRRDLSSSPASSSNTFYPSTQAYSSVTDAQEESTLTVLQSVPDTTVEPRVTSPAANVHVAAAAIEPHSVSTPVLHSVARGVPMPQDAAATMVDSASVGVSASSDANIVDIGSIVDASVSEAGVDSSVLDASVSDKVDDFQLLNAVVDLTLDTSAVVNSSLDSTVVDSVVDLSAFVAVVDDSVSKSAVEAPAVDATVFDRLEDFQVTNAVVDTAVNPATVNSAVSDNTVVDSVIDSSVSGEFVNFPVSHAAVDSAVNDSVVCDKTELDEDFQVLDTGVNFTVNETVANNNSVVESVANSSEHNRLTTRRQNNDDATGMSKHDSSSAEMRHQNEFIFDSFQPVKVDVVMCADEQRSADEDTTETSQSADDNDWDSEEKPDQSTDSNAAVDKFYFCMNTDTRAAVAVAAQSGSGFRQNADQAAVTSFSPTDEDDEDENSENRLDQSTDSNAAVGKFYFSMDTANAAADDGTEKNTEQNLFIGLYPRDDVVSDDDDGDKDKQISVTDASGTSQTGNAIVAADPSDNDTGSRRSSANSSNILHETGTFNISNGNDEASETSTDIVEMGTAKDVVDTVADNEFRAAASDAVVITPTEEQQAAGNWTVTGEPSVTVPLPKRRKAGEHFASEQQIIASDKTVIDVGLNRDDAINKHEDQTASHELHFDHHNDVDNDVTVTLDAASFADISPLISCASPAGVNVAFEQEHSDSQQYVNDHSISDLSVTDPTVAQQSVSDQCVNDQLVTISNQSFIDHSVIDRPVIVQCVPDQSPQQSAIDQSISLNTSDSVDNNANFADFEQSGVSNNFSTNYGLNAIISEPPSQIEETAVESLFVTEQQSESKPGLLADVKSETVEREMAAGNDERGYQVISVRQNFEQEKEQLATASPQQAEVDSESHVTVKLFELDVSFSMINESRKSANKQRNVESSTTSARNNQSHCTSEPEPMTSSDDRDDVNDVTRAQQTTNHAESVQLGNSQAPLTTTQRLSPEQDAAPQRDQQRKDSEDGKPQNGASEMDPVERFRDYEKRQREKIQFARASELARRFELLTAAAAASSMSSHPTASRTTSAAASSRVSTSSGKPIPAQTTAHRITSQSTTAVMSGPTTDEGPRRDRTSATNHHQSTSVKRPVQPTFSAGTPTTSQTTALAGHGLQFVQNTKQVVLVSSAGSSRKSSVDAGDRHEKNEGGTHDQTETIDASSQRTVSNTEDDYQLAMNGVPGDNETSHGTRNSTEVRLEQDGVETHETQTETIDKSDQRVVSNTEDDQLLAMNNDGSGNIEPSSTGVQQEQNDVAGTYWRETETIDAPSSTTDSRRVSNTDDVEQHAVNGTRTDSSRKTTNCKVTVQSEVDTKATSSSAAAAAAETTQTHTTDDSATDELSRVRANLRSNVTRRPSTSYHFTAGGAKQSAPR